jgi:hypothetical protein
MTGETIQNTTKTFKFSYPTCTNEDVLFKLEVPVEIPHGGSTRELVQRVINMFHIPVYLEDGNCIKIDSKPLIYLKFHTTFPYYNKQYDTIVLAA